MDLESRAVEGTKVDFMPDIDFKIVSREKWNALPPVSKETIPLPAQRVFFMFTDTPRCHSKSECIASVQEIQKDFMGRGMPDLPFSFLVGGDLRVYEGRGWGVKISRSDVLDWHDERVVIGYICPQALADDRTDNMIRKGYQVMYHGIENKYLENFDDHAATPPNIEDEVELMKRYKDDKAMKEEEEKKKNERREMRRKAREEASKADNGDGDKEIKENSKCDTENVSDTHVKEDDNLQKEESNFEGNEGTEGDERI